MSAQPAGSSLILPGLGTARLRIRADPTDAEESRLERASRAGSGACIERLAERMCGFRLDQIDRTLAASTPMVLDVNAEFLGSLGGIEALDGTLGGVDASGPLTRIMPDTAAAALVRPSFKAGGQRRLRAIPAAEAIVAGTTLILNDIGGRAHPALAELVDATSRVTGTHVGVNAYVSERGETGFGFHWDDHDVIIIQLTGSKHWRIFEPHELAPLRGWSADMARGREAMSILLRPGMGLMVPRGWGHQVRGFAGELSTHLTISITRPRIRDMVELAARDPAIADSANAVVDVDRPSAADITFDDATLEHLRGGWLARLVSQTADDPIKAAAARSASEEARVKGMFLGGAVFADPPDRSPDAVVLAAANHLIHLPRKLVGAMAMLLEGDSHTVAELAAASPEAALEEVAALVSELAVADLVRCGTES